jgi:hypothetical protein
MAAIQACPTLRRLRKNGFYLSARDSDTSDRIRLYCHRASRSRRHQNTPKTDCPVKIRLRKRDGIYRIQGNRELEHSHPLLTFAQEDIPGDIQETANDLLKGGMDKSCILEFIHLRTGRVLSRSQLAALDSDDLPLALATDTDVLWRTCRPKESAGCSH